MPYEGPFSNRLPDNLVRITEMGTYFLIPEEGKPTAPVDIQQEEGLNPPSMGQTKIEAQKPPIILDATEEYSKNLAASVTSHPVGDKTDRADHYHVNPLTVELSGVISNDKLHVYNWVNNLSGKSPIQQTVLRLEGLVNNKTLIRIEIPDTPTVENCMITSLSITRDNKLSNGFRVKLTAQQIMVIDEDILKEPAKDKKDSVQEKTESCNRTTTDKGIGSGEGSVAEGVRKINQLETVIIERFEKKAP